MNDEERINPGHVKVRSYLRIIGPTVLSLGLLFTLVGTISFFRSFGSFESPRYFWCCFVGLPLIFFGIVITVTSFQGKISRYMAAESAPVSKDTFNYMATGIAPGVQELAGAVKDGFSDHDEITVQCHQCHEPNDIDAKFCDHCGGALAVPKKCPSCTTENNFDAGFCDQCGQKF